MDKKAVAVPILSIMSMNPDDNNAGYPLASNCEGDNGTEIVDDKRSDNSEEEIGMPNEDDMRY